MFNESEIRNFIEKSGIEREVEFIPLKGGRNNRLFRVNDFVLKIYFSHSVDKRDRLGHEYKFIKFVWDKGIREVPEPIAASHEQNVALFEYIDGRKIDSFEITRKYIDLAITFIKDINRFRKSTKAKHLPNAADSAFSIQGHIDNIERRIEALSKIGTHTDTEWKVSDFLDSFLVPEWKKQKNECRKKALDLNVDLDYSISIAEKCLSPSDFGFHNALLKHDGGIVFLDFEYAGWDDPVKMICDFFCQPEVAVPIGQFDYFLAELESLFDQVPGDLRQRTELFLPLNRLKWCCIMLNDFLWIDNERRSFAERKNADVRKKEQLDRTKEYFNTVFNH